MKWDLEPMPRSGQTRRKAKFAFFPTKVFKHINSDSEECTVWFETYYLVQVSKLLYTGRGQMTIKWITIRKEANECPDL